MSDVDPTATSNPTPLFEAFPPVETSSWLEQIAQDLGNAEFEKRLVWHTEEGFDVAPFYRSQDLDHWPRPFQGLHGGNDWLIKQDIAVADIETANRLAREALAGGADSIGFIPMHSHAQHGIPVNTPADLIRLLQGISLDGNRLHFGAGPATLNLLKMLWDVAEAQDIDLKKLEGGVSFDPVGWLANHGSLPVSETLDSLGATIKELDAQKSNLQILQVDARVYHNAGANMTLELACIMAGLSEYLAHFTEQGLEVEQVLRRLRLIIPVGTSYFMSIAKLRALRILFHQVVQAYDHTQASVEPYVEAISSWWHQTHYAPDVNLLRTTTEAAAAILGGCQTLTLLPYDAVAKPANTFSLRLARNIQLILRHEAYLDKVADPGAGAYYLETLTEKLAQASWTIFREIEEAGGLLASLNTGMLQSKISESRKHRLDTIESGKQVMVGINKYPNPNEEAMPTVITDSMKNESSSAAETTVEPLPTLRAAAIVEAQRQT